MRGNEYAGNIAYLTSMYHYQICQITYCEFILHIWTHLYLQQHHETEHG